ncbi:hypothetical protein DL96DRAFT_1119741 [Flagelloscypha sp. PMI_526]|nr:hypothetical protein DL96DRAFT_1119741 [Flagelloscypha sp. PMI_526]
MPVPELPPEIWYSIAQYFSTREIERFKFISPAFERLALLNSWHTVYLDLPMGHTLQTPRNESKSKAWIQEAETNNQKTLDYCKEACASQLVKRLQLHIHEAGLEHGSGKRLYRSITRRISVGKPPSPVTGKSYEKCFRRFTSVESVWVHLGGQDSRGPPVLSLTHAQHPMISALWERFGSTLVDLNISLPGNFEQLCFILPTGANVAEPLPCLQKFAISIMSRWIPDPWYPNTRKCKGDKERQALLEIMAYLAGLYRTPHLTHFAVCLQTRIDGLFETLLPEENIFHFPKLQSLMLEVMPSQNGLPEWEGNLARFLVSHISTLRHVTLRYIGVPHLRILMRQLQAHRDSDANQDSRLSPGFPQIGVLLFPSSDSNKISALHELVKIPNEVAPLLGASLTNLSVLTHYIRFKEPKLLEVLPELGKTFPAVTGWCAQVRFMSPLFIVELAKAFPLLENLCAHYQALHVKGKKASPKQFVKELNRLTGEFLVLQLRHNLADECMLETDPTAQAALRNWAVNVLGIWVGHNKKADYELVYGVAKHMSFVDSFWNQGDKLE